MGRVLTPASDAASDGPYVKASWPEVVGWTTRNAGYKIISDRPDVFPDYYSDTTPLPGGYNPNRVIVIFDNDGSIVVKTPVIG